MRSILLFYCCTASVALRVQQNVQQNSTAIIESNVETNASCKNCQCPSCTGNSLLSQPFWMWMNPVLGYCYHTSLDNLQTFVECHVNTPWHSDMGPVGARLLPWLSLPGTPDCAALGFKTRCLMCEIGWLNTNIYVNPLGEKKQDDDNFLKEGMPAWIEFLKAHPHCDHDIVDKFAAAGFHGIVPNKV